MFRATQPYLTEPVDPRLFCYENAVFFVGVFIIEVLSLNIKKITEPTLPKVFKTVARNTRFFFWPWVHAKLTLSPVSPGGQFNPRPQGLEGVVLTFGVAVPLAVTLPTQLLVGTQATQVVGRVLTTDLTHCTETSKYS